MLSIITHKYGEYATHPLRFVKFSLPASDGDFVAIMKALNRWYSDTDQDSDDWAKEFELIFRMFAVENALVLNPKYLALDEVREELMSYLPPSLHKEYAQALELLAKGG